MSLRSSSKPNICSNSVDCAKPEHSMPTNTNHFFIGFTAEPGICSDPCHSRCAYKWHGITWLHICVCIIWPRTMNDCIPAQILGRTSIKFDGCSFKPNLEKAIDQLGNTILRLKGIVYFADNDIPHIVQCVGSRCTITPVQQPDMSNEPQSRLVAIGLKDKLDIEALDTRFDLCQINE